MDYLTAKTKQVNLPFNFIFSKPGMGSLEIVDEIEKVAATDVVVCGGDGTVNMVAQAIAGKETRLGIIPVGSGNGLARSAGVPLKPGAALRTVFQGRTEKTDAFLVNNNFSCMLSGLGLDAAVAESFSRSSSRGLYTYTTNSIIEFLKASPFPFSLKTDSLKIDSSAYFISIANSNQFGNNFTIAPRASLHDGLLDIVIVKKMWKVKMLYAIIKQLNSGYPVSSHSDNPESEDIIYIQTSSLTIANPMLAKLHIDGDPAETSELLKIRVLPGTFNLIIP